MNCAGNVTALARGANHVEFCFDHFEPASLRGEDSRPAFVLHALGLTPEDQTAAFALVPVANGSLPHYFKARWGRVGVGPANFVPIPGAIESKTGLDLYGVEIAGFHWRSFHWEISEKLDGNRAGIPSIEGDVLQPVSNAPGVWALRNGAPLVRVDSLPIGFHDEFGLEKESEPGGSYLVRYGGRTWRVGGAESAELELLGFDTQSQALQDALDEVWSEIGGQEDAKRELIRAIQWPVLYPELFRLFKRRRSRGVLLYGPPGCGKTLLGRSVVRLLAALHHRRAEDGGFKYVKGHQLLDQYVGNSEKAVRALFDEARRWKEERGYPAVLFFDEADALFRRRTSAATQVFTLVPALLAEMDGMDESGAFVILATNRPDTLDVAVTRPGRIDRRIRVTRPDEAASRKIFRIHFEGVFLEEGLAIEDLCASAARDLFDPAHVLYDLVFDDSDRTVPFCLKDLASGALIQNIVDRATANKMEHCIVSGATAGLNGADLRQATTEVLAEQRESRHTEEVEEFAETAGRRLADVRRYC